MKPKIKCINVINERIRKFYLMHTANAMNIIYLVDRIIEGSDK